MLADDDARLVRAFKQRYERLVAASARLGLERLCEEIVSAHDYDLAVLTRWDGKRRYANLRKLMRLARSYEELRGPDIEGFISFIADQEAVGATQLEAVSEEEGSGAVRLLTIHSAKGLEFKVVVVADAGRDTVGAPAADEILVGADGRFGFRVIDPTSGRRAGVFAYEEVRAAEESEDRAERLRLYYVAMTRAIDRLIVSGAIDPDTARDRDTPIGWVLSRLGVDDGEIARAAGEPLELERGDARFVLRVDRYRPRAAEEPLAASDGQLALFAELPTAPAPRGYRLPELVPPPVPPLHRVRRLSYSALALFDRCSYRYYAERVAGLREVRPVGDGGGATGLAATEIGDAVHRLLEVVDLRAPAVPELEQVRGWYPLVTEDELERIGEFVAAYCESEHGARVAALEGARPERPFAFEHDGVLLHGRLDVLWRDGPRAFVLDYKTNSLAESSPEEIVEDDYRTQRLVYALACFRAGAEEVEVVYHFVERPDAVVSTTFRREELSALEAELSEAIQRINRGEFVPTPSDFACSGCPALDLVCAGPRLRQPPPARRECRVVSSPRRGGASPRRSNGSARSSNGSPHGMPTRDRAPVPGSARAARQRDAVGADDRRERQPGHRAAVPEVSPPRGLPGSPARGARARHLRNRLLPAEGQGAAGHDDDADRGARRRGAGRFDDAPAASGRCTQDGERRLRRTRQPQGIVVDTHVRRLSQRLGLTRQEDP